MKPITFATSNQGKVFTFQGYLRSHGLEVEVVQRPVEMIEPQANTVEEVVRVKAQQAYEQLKQPLLVDDSSFHIEALGGFPGPYVKYMVETVGEAGIIEFMKGKANRRAYFMNALAFVDEDGVVHEFSSRDVEGEIVDYIDDYDHPRAWSGLWKIFQIDGFDKTISRMTEDDHALKHEMLKAKNSSYDQLATWLKAKG